MIILVIYSSSVYSCHPFLISSASVRSIPFLSFIEPICAWNVLLVSLIFLKRLLVFSILLVSSISLHWSLRKSFLSFLAILSLQGASIRLVSSSIRGQTNWKPQLQKTDQSDHMDHALPNSVKLWAMPIWPPKMDRSWRRILTKCCSLEKGMVNHFSIPALRTPWTVWKGKKIGHLKDEVPNLGGAQIATGDQWSNNSRKNEEMESKQRQHSAVDVIEAKSNAVKSNIA